MIAFAYDVLLSGYKPTKFGYVVNKVKASLTNVSMRCCNGDLPFVALLEMLKDSIASNHFGQ